jgi:hypothetical protein
VSAEIISLCERRPARCDVPELDVITAIDVAIRDLCEIEVLCDSTEARQRAAAFCQPAATASVQNQRFSGEDVISTRAVMTLPLNVEYPVSRSRAGGVNLS